MGELVTDEMLNAFGIMAEPAGLVDEIISRYGDFVDRTNGGFTFVDGETRMDMVAKLRAA